MKKKLLLKGLFLASLFFTNLVFAQSVFINEIHYDNEGADVNEGVEIAGPAGTDLSGYQILLYNGAPTQIKLYNPRTTLSGSIPNLQNGFGTIFFPIVAIQNGDPDGIALIDPDGGVVQFLSYGGTFIPIDGPAAGMESTDIGVKQGSATPIGYSLQLTGEGSSYSDFTWAPEAQNTYGQVNTNQSFGGEVTDPDPEPQPEPEPLLPPAPAIDVVFINEIHYDNAGADVNEGVEIAGTAGTDLSGYQILLYNGAPTQIKLYNPKTTLSGIIPNQQNGFGTVFFPIAGIQNGDPDGIALIDPDGGVVQFLSYGGTFIPVDGPAAGMESTDIGVKQGSATPIGYSLQLTGQGSSYSDFTWAPEAQNTYGEVNTGQTFLSPEPVLFINEIHYDNIGADVEEGVEIAGTAGTDLSGYQILLYNGAPTQIKLYNPRTTLSGIIPNQQNGYGTIFFPIAAIQNGDPDGIALIDPDGSVVQFLSYGGTFIPVDGPAAGMESTDIGVKQSSSTPIGYSLQLTGEGSSYSDFTWAPEALNTYGQINTNQSFGGAVIEPEPAPEPAEEGSIAAARQAEVGTKLTIEGVLTATDHFGNTAFIQDETAGIALFGNLVTEKGLYKIGDSLRITGIRAVFNDQVQLSNLETVEYLGIANEPIEPVSITLSQIEDYRGQLVKITDMIFPGPGQLFFGNSNYMVTDSSGKGELRINSSVESLVGKLQPETCSEVVGVVGRFRTINQLLPRNDTDLPCAEPYDPTFPGSEISKDLTFDAVTWNIEWFGDEKNSPAAGKPDSDAIQKEAVKAVLLELNADVIAVQEISDEVLFAEMVGEMEGYDFILSDATSYPDSPGGQKVGFIYNSETVSVTASRAMMTSVHPFYEGDGSLLQDYPESPDRFYASGRLPFLMEAAVTIDGHKEDMKFIALHARANGSTGAQGRYDMRKYDVEVLKDSIDHYFPNDKVMILGDFNDDVDYTVANVSTTVSTYVSYTSDTANYSVLTGVLSEQGYRSYAIGNYDDMIDHIMVTDELFDNYIEGSARVHYEFYNSDFTYTTSDHFPVSVRLKHKGLITTVEATPVTCFETATGTATAIASGGIAPYTYKWSDDQVTQTASALLAGIYTVTVTDYLGETASVEIKIEETEVLSLNMEDQKVYLGYEASCTTLQPLELTGGAGKYTYLWSTGETSENISVCPKETSAYTLEVTDAFGCTISAEVIVEVADISCGNGSNEKVSLCFNGKSLCVSTNAVPALLKNGAVLGSCENEVALVIEETAVSPNPTTGETVVKVKSAMRSAASLQIYNLSGQRIQEQKITLEVGTSTFDLNLGRAIPGMYIIKIEGSGFESNPVKLIKY